MGVSFEFTYACNLRCVHCYAVADKSLPNELTTAEIKNFIDEIVDMKVYSIVLSGGEPLLREDFFEILKYTSERGLRVIVSTNGTLLNWITAEKIKSSGVDIVQVSLDGANAETHDRFRGVQGAFHRALQGIRALEKAGVEKIGVATCATTLNYEEIPQLIDYLSKNTNVTRMRILRFLPIGKGRAQKELVLDHSRIVNLYNTIENKNQKLDGRLKVTFSEAFNPPLFDRPTHICTGGKTWCAVNPEGYVLPCTYLNSSEVARRLGADTIRKRSFKYIWKNSSLLKGLRELTRHIKGKCQDCNLLNRCGGGCRAAAYAYYDDIFASDPHCVYSSD